MLSASEAPPVKTTSAGRDAERARGGRARGIEAAAGVAPRPVRLRRVAEVLAQVRLHRLPGLVRDGRRGGVIGVDAHVRTLPCRPVQRLPPAAGLVLLAALWGASYLFIKVALHDFSPVFVTWLRLVLGLAVVLPVAARAGVLLRLRGHGRHLLIVATVQIVLPVTLVAVGELWIASSLAGLLNATIPLFVALLAPALDHTERMGGRRLVGLGIGFAGVACLVGLDLGDNRHLLLGAACLTLSSLGYALGNLTGKRYLSDVPPLAIVAGLLAVAAVLTSPLALAGLPSQAPGLRPVAAVAALGFAGTGLAYLLYYHVMQRIGPARTSLVAYLIPLFALVYGVALLHEPLTAGLAVGMPLVLAGCWLAGRRP